MLCFITSIEVRKADIESLGPNYLDVALEV